HTPSSYPLDILYHPCYLHLSKHPDWPSLDCISCSCRRHEGQTADSNVNYFDGVRTRSRAMAVPRLLHSIV
ncbi:unnamed protein product, partial [Pleuronectes platessa]